MPENKGIVFDNPGFDEWDLDRAAKENSVFMVRALIARGDDVEARSKDGWTPLHHAALTNTLEVALLLIDRGADIEAKDDEGSTPMWVAERYKSLDVARLLIEHGANTDGIDLSWIDEQEDDS